MKTIPLLWAKKIPRSLSIVLPVLALILSLHGSAGSLVNGIGRGHIHDQAIAFLQESERKTKEIFLLLSVAKAGVSVVESAQGGVSFLIEAEVQLGKIFSALKHLLDQAWSICLAALSLLFVSQLLLNYINSLLPPLLMFLSAIWLAHALCQYFAIPCRYAIERVLRVGIVVVLFITVALPLAIYGTSAIAAHIVPIAGDIHQKTRASLAQHNDFFEHSATKESLKKNSESIIKKLKAYRQDAHKQVQALHTTIYQHIAILAVEIIVLPVLLLWLFFLMLRAATGAHYPQYTATSG